VWRNTIYHEGLKASRVIRGESQAEVQLKAQLQMEAWNQRWQRIQQAEAKRLTIQESARVSYQKKELAAQRTREAQVLIAALGTILKDGIELDHTLDWEAGQFGVPAPVSHGPSDPNRS
jgi:hypothetical protein